MSSEPSLSGREVVRVLRELGFQIDRVEGSHHMMTKPDYPNTVAVPVHGSKGLPKGTLASIIRSAGVSRKRFFKLAGS